ncbi:MAG: acetyl-CoA carboxylase biotin carboxyl carrier protein [Kiritimatiellae bacterium]|nr:acetyl-CoA carboxylase biotin carboxyl carrier protein [Kiritimatiellia bacterium]
MATKKTTKAKKTAKTPVAKTSSVPQTPAKGMMADVQNLMEMMSAHDVTEIDIKDGVRRISLKRGGLVAPVMAAPMGAPMHFAAPAAAPAPAAEAKDAAPAEKFIEIKSPMVGTFYAAPSPDSDPYADVGTRVNAETVVCIVEAMKVMNEIKAEVSGTIVEVCVKNAQAVEFGQVMFRVKP